MQIGIGLPNPIPGTPGRVLVEWARRAEQRGFSTLATIDRIVYPGYESLTALAAAAAVTDRIGLMTNILIAPVRNAMLLAKEAASVDQLSGGRLTLGLAVGARDDDYAASEQPFHDRGARFDEQLETMHRVWRGEPVGGASHPAGPRPVNGDRVPVVFGGYTDPTFARVVRWGVGWTAGGSGADQVGPLAERVRAAWTDARKDGSPRIVALSYYALGGKDDAGRAYLRDYYAYLGDYAEMIAGSLLASPDAIREAVVAFDAAGVDELIFDPTVAEIDQVDLLADLVTSY